MQNDMSGVGETMTGYELNGRSELALFTDSQDLAHLLGKVECAALQGGILLPNFRIISVFK